MIRIGNALERAEPQMRAVAPVGYLQGLGQIIWGSDVADTMAA